MMPPALWRRILSSVAPEEDRAAVLSDLDELYRERRARFGSVAAARWYRRQVRSFVAARVLGRWAPLNGPPDRMGGHDRMSVIDRVREDVRFAWRQLVRNPAAAFVAVGVLGIGIGASAAIYNVVHGVVLAPLPYPDSDRLVRLQQVLANGARAGLAPPAHLLFERSELRTVESVAITTPGGLDLEGAGEPEHLRVSYVSGGFFDLLRAGAAAGRTFAADADRAGAAVVVLSHALWSRRFNSDAAIVGTTIRLGGEPRTVLGVMPPDFDFPAGTAAWLPVSQQLAGMEEVWGALFLDGIARLRDGADPAAASAELSGLLDRIPDAGGHSAVATSLHDELTAAVRSPLLLLLGAVVLMLLVACANVGALLLARALERRRELALRSALGATRRRITAGLLTEGVLLGLVAGGLGALLSTIMLDALLFIAPGDLPRASELGMDVRTFLFTVCVSLIAGVLAGLIPATQSTRSLGAIIREGAGTHTSSVKGARARGALVVAQTAAAIVLLTGAGLLVVSFFRLMGQQAGFDARELMTVELNLPAHRYESTAELLAFYDVVLERMRQVPGVEGAAVTRNLPMGGRNLTAPVHAPGGRNVSGTIHVSATADYLELMRTRVLSGRSYSDDDVRAGRRPAVLSESLALRLFGAGDAIGQRVVTAFGQDTMDVIGVVQDVRFASLADDPRPVLYRPLAHWPSRGVHIALRSARPPADLFPAVRTAMHEVHPEQPIVELATMQTLLARTAARPRFYAQLFTGFAAMALTLSALGLYGLLVSDVARQHREIGIRLALGARVEQVAARVVGRGLALTGVGAAAGVVIAIAGARLLEGLLFSVPTRDPATFGIVVLVLIFVSLLATIPAALRVMRVDPGRELAS